MSDGTATRHQPRRRFGQNFLRDQRIIQQIISSAGIQPDDTVVEIGPGEGALTRHLLLQCQRLIVIELDRDLAARLRRQYAGDQLEVIEQDALQADLSALTAQPYRLLGNLPYNISTPLLFHFFDHIGAWQDAHIMLQKEVAVRMTAAVGSSEYSRLTVMTGLYVDAEIVFDVPPEAFYPAPKVTSSIVRLRPSDNPLPGPGWRRSFSELVKTAFAQRRKTLANNFKGVLDRELIERADIDPGRRAQTLSVSDFKRLLQIQREGCAGS